MCFISVLYKAKVPVLIAYSTGLDSMLLILSTGVYAQPGACGTKFNLRTFKDPVHAHFRHIDVIALL